MTKRKLLKYSAILTTVMLSIVIVIFIVDITNSINPIPKVIKNQLTFSPMVALIQDNKYITNVSDYKFSKVEDGTEILSFVIKTSNKSIVVSEYVQPPEFNEVEGYKDKFLNNIANQYDTVQTYSGIIYLGRMTKQNNKQMGVMIEKGLIVFLSPDKDLDKNEWLKIGNSLELIK